MADYTLTSANVVFSSAAVKIPVTFGETIAGAGVALYRHATDLDALGNGKVYKADANAATPAYVLAGVSCGGGSAGQFGYMCVSDPDYTHGLATPAAGQIGILSATAGAFAPSADGASGYFTQVAMVMKSATKAVLAIVNGTAAIP